MLPGAQVIHMEEKALSETEATDMLSAWVFIAMVKQYKSNKERVVKVKYVNDNMEVVKRGREHKTYKESDANTTLRAEYDLTEQIYIKHSVAGLNYTKTIRNQAKNCHCLYS